MESQTRRGIWWSFTRSVATAFEASAQERQPDMKKTSTKMADQDIPELNCHFIFGMQLKAYLTFIRNGIGKILKHFDAI